MAGWRWQIINAISFFFLCGDRDTNKMTETGLLTNMKYMVGMKEGEGQRGGGFGENGLAGAAVCKDWR